MSTPSSGQPSPTLRVAGIGLIALALVILVVGAVGVLNDDVDTSPAAAAGASTSATAPGSESASASPTLSSSSAPSSATTTTTAASPSAPASSGAPSAPPAADSGAGAAGGAPGAGGSTGGGGAAGGSVDFAVPVRVFNNSTITGLAASAAARLQSDGWEQVSTGNYQQGVIPTTTVYYRPGTGEQTAADQIAADLGVRSEARFEGLTDASPGVILIVTDDFSG